MALSHTDIPRLLRNTSKGQLIYRREETNLSTVWPYDSSCDERSTAIHPSCLKFQSDEKSSKYNNADIILKVDVDNSDAHVKSELMKLDDNLNDTNLETIQEQLREHEELEKEAVQKYYQSKRELYKSLNDKLYRDSTLLLQSFNLLRTQDQYMKSSKLEATLHESQIEIEKKISKLKNAHKSRAKESAERLEEAHQKDRFEAAEAHKKSLEIQQRYGEFTASGRRLFAAYQEMAIIIKAQENIRTIPDTIRQAVQSVNSIMSQYQKMVKQFSTRILEQKDLEIIQSLEINTIQFLKVIKESIEAVVTSKPVAVEVIVKPPDAAVSEIKSTHPQPLLAPPSAVQNVKKVVVSDVESLKKFNHYIKIQTKADELRDEIKSNKDLKTYRNDIQKYINSTINAISDHSGSHLLDKQLKLLKLLEGNNVSVTNRTVSVKSHQFGKDFCLDLIVRKFIVRITLLTFKQYFALSNRSL
ncbi:Nuclear pore complex nucleoporin component, variant 2 [Chamberlinius hualienensis]